MNISEVYDQYERSYFQADEMEDMAQEAPVAAPEGADQRQVGSAIDEALVTAGTAVLGSIPAGLGGILELLKTGDVDSAVSEIERIQGALTVLPESEAGMAALESAMPIMETLSAPAEYVGQKTLETTGSPALATGAEIVADPLNLIGAGLVAKPLMAARKAVKAQKGTK